MSSDAQNTDDEATLRPGFRPKGRSSGPTLLQGAGPGGELPPEGARFGRYRLDRILGRGGMGAVYLAHDTVLERVAAIKLPLFGEDDGEEMRRRFVVEAKAAAALTHANICPMFDAGVIDGQPYISMAYIEGQSLDQLLRRSPEGLPPRQAATLVRKLCAAFAEAHRLGIVHRDIKPANVMLNKQGEPVVMDFGLARRTASEAQARLTQDGVLMGTPAFMPPEQVAGRTALMGPNCDIYSLGVVLYACLTGRLPFPDDDLVGLVARIALEPPPPLRTFRADLDPGLEAICLKAIEKRIEDRFASMADFAAALGAWLKADAAREPRPAGPATPLPSPTPAESPALAPAPLAEAPTVRPREIEPRAVAAPQPARTPPRPAAKPPATVPAALSEPVPVSPPRRPIQAEIVAAVPRRRKRRRRATSPALLVLAGVMLTLLVGGAIWGAQRLTVAAAAAQPLPQPQETLPARPAPQETPAPAKPQPEPGPDLPKPPEPPPPRDPPKAEPPLPLPMPLPLPELPPKPEPPPRMEPPPRPPPPPLPKRCERWRYHQGSFIRVASKRWQEKGDDGKKFDFTESHRTTHYIELRRKEGDSVKLIRLFGGHAELAIDDGPFRLRYEGRWQ